MATRIRLQRHGKKGRPFYHLVVADQRAKRDGRFIEKLGTYDPNTDPATIEINFENALSWVKKGASPSDTARAILSYKGVLLKHHLDKGVLKGALSQTDADKKFEVWLKEKEAKISAKAESISKSAKAKETERLKAEQAANEAKAQAIAAKNTPQPEEAPASEEVSAEETQVSEAEASVTPDNTTEEATTEASTESVAEEAPAAEAEKEVEEPKAEEPKAEEAAASSDSDKPASEENQPEEAPEAEETKKEE